MLSLDTSYYTKFGVWNVTVERNRVCKTLKEYTFKDEVNTLWPSYKKYDKIPEIPKQGIKTSERFLCDEE